MIVVDSSFLIANYNIRDVFHRSALSLMQSLVDGRWGKTIVLEYVFLETISVLKRKVSVAAALHAGQFLRRAHEVDFVAGGDVFAAVWNEFQSDFMTPLSFTDTAIVHVARQRAGGKVLTFDKGFRDLPGITIEPTVP